MFGWISRNENSNIDGNHILIGGRKDMNEFRKNYLQRVYLGKIDAWQVQRIIGNKWSRLYMWICVLALHYFAIWTDTDIFYELVVHGIPIKLFLAQDNGSIGTLESLAIMNHLKHMHTWSHQQYAMIILKINVEILMLGHSSLDHKPVKSQELFYLGNIRWFQFITSQHLPMHQAQNRVFTLFSNETGWHLVKALNWIKSFGISDLFFFMY